MEWADELPEEFEEYECSSCKNRFFVEVIVGMQEINRPCYCPYCGTEFGWYLQMDGEAE